MKLLLVLTMILLSISFKTDTMQQAEKSKPKEASEESKKDSWDSWWQLSGEEKILHKNILSYFAEFIRDATERGRIKPEKNPATPGWIHFDKIDFRDPEYKEKRKAEELASPHRRTIEKLAYGPHKGMKARIERSCWSLWGVDTIYSAEPDHIIGVNLPMMWNYYINLPPLHIDGYLPIYFGHLLTENGHNPACVIPESWLSNADKINLFNFHRWELSVLASKYGPQIFDPNSPARPMLRAKIANELKRGQTIPIVHFLRVHRHAILQDPDGIERMQALEQLNKEFDVSRETADPSNIWSDSIFLHALFLEALKHQDVEILTNRRILYNSLWALDQKSLAETKKKEGDLTDEAIHAEIVKWQPLAEIMREHEYTDQYDKLYTDFLPRDIRLIVIAMMLHKSPTNQLSNMPSQSLNPTS